jgi:hypothetical protein
VTSPGPAFSLSYDLTQADIAETYAMRPALRTRRRGATALTVIYALLGGFLTVITVLLDVPHVVQGSTGAPGWMYTADLVCWLIAAASFWGVVRRSPRWLARRNLRHRPDMFGPNHDEISDRGITWTAPDGAEVFTPWSVLASYREGADYFYIYDKNGTMRSELPKRGLSSPELIPALRDYLSRAINDHSQSAGK